MPLRHKCRKDYTVTKNYIKANSQDRRIPVGGFTGYHLSGVKLHVCLSLRDLGG